MSSDFKEKLHDFLDRISFFGVDHTKEYNVDDVNDSKPVCILAYFGILFFLPLVLRKGSRYGRFHANQGLLLFFISIVVCILRWLMYMPANVLYLGAIMMVLSDILSFVLGSFLLSLFVFGLVNAARGRAIDLPVIGRFKIIK